LFNNDTVDPFIFIDTGNKNSGALTNELSLNFPSTNGYPIYSSSLPVSFFNAVISLDKDFKLCVYANILSN